MFKTVAKLCADNNRHTVVGLLQPLLQLQRVDTALLQLAHHQASLAERTSLTVAKAALVATQSKHNKLLTELKAVKEEIVALEAANKKCELAIQKYSQQLKTVIAPREAEALQHEIETVRVERSGNDDKELALLENSENLDSQILELSEQIVSQQASVEQATLALKSALTTCEADKQKLDAQRSQVASEIDPKLIKLYDVKRNKRTTPAVADLHGTKCQSCHLDLSVVELSALKKLVKNETSETDGNVVYAECPNCDCYLVI
jgi:predicted  nucleic acid-binding Zn-ribbon protein